jgi:hypothetical protein
MYHFPISPCNDVLYSNSDTNPELPGYENTELPSESFTDIIKTDTGKLVKHAAESRDYVASPVVIV